MSSGKMLKIETRVRIRKIIRRLAEYLLTLFIIIALNFFIPRLLPGNPLLSLSRGSEEGVSSLSQKQVDYYMEFYGLDKPMYEQFFDYLGDLLHLDLGRSVIYNLPVTEFIFERIQWTLLLIGLSLLITSVFGALLGALSAYRRNGFLDKSLYFGMLTLSEIRRL